MVHSVAGCLNFYIKNMNQNINIIFQNENVVVVNKPAGMLVHRSWLAKDETAFLMQTLRNQLQQYVFPVHRLDRPTSGAMLFALNTDTARYLTQQFKNKEIQKTYHAIVRGWTDVSGCIDYPLREQLDDIADKFAQRNKLPQNAITEYHTLAQSELPFASHKNFKTSRYSLLRITPHTGRKHQIRRHMKHIFHPIVGDTTHGDLRQNKAVHAFCGNTRLLLHAHSLVFRLPENNEWIQVVASYDNEWCRVAQALNLCI